MKVAMFCAKRFGPTIMGTVSYCVFFSRYFTLASSSSMLNLEQACCFLHMHLSSEKALPKL
jgi:hypothetical protein